ncbi:DUF3883 domain-containing protein [Methanobacterium lacus]|uniref:DUF3883 domain-containing protein n=1 Tax=Methanobacterium lacus (strain AL-21) TaxID=877455 RepID=UPI001D0F7137|nr:DUF3883 domain-containing protein [Methanobacterium lacus]
MNKRIIFLNVGWMKSYQGIINGDIIQGGGSYVHENKFGHEVYNFLPYDGFVYGFVQPPRSSKIHIERLGADPKDDSIDNVLAIWVATKPTSGNVIVGWYKDATLYKEYQYSDELNRNFKDEKIGYNVKAKEEDSKLLALDERVFHIKRGKGWMGQSNIWYASQESNEDFRNEVLNYIYENIIPKKNDKKRNHSISRQVDTYQRQKIEVTAINHTIKYYEKYGYTVESKEKDNVGWDLEAVMDNIKLKIEVKGLSQENVAIELTPNEYEKMKEFKEDYRISVVTNALKKPILRIFSYNDENGIWQDIEGNKLEIDEKVSAKCYVN